MAPLRFATFLHEIEGGGRWNENKDATLQNATDKGKQSLKIILELFLSGTTCYIIWVSWISSLVSNLHEFKKRERKHEIGKGNVFLKQDRFQKYFIPPPHRGTNVEKSLTGRWLSVASLRVSYHLIPFMGKATPPPIFPSQFLPPGNGHVFLSNGRFFHLKVTYFRVQTVMLKGYK